MLHHKVWHVLPAMHCQHLQNLQHAPKGLSGVNWLKLSCRCNFLTLAPRMDCTSSEDLYFATHFPLVSNKTHTGIPQAHWSWREGEIGGRRGGGVQQANLGVV